MDGRRNRLHKIFVGRDFYNHAKTVIHVSLFIFFVFVSSFFIFLFFGVSFFRKVCLLFFNLIFFFFFLSLFFLHVFLF